MVEDERGAGLSNLTNENASYGLANTVTQTTSTQTLGTT